ncbi:MAG: CtsR family transcriptional regulator [Ruminococcaceae bacterium]|nr:CtsR family transcriptional regulator [Oscillospiraceae bacterium]
MNLSNTIADMIFQMLDEKSEIEFQRNLLAQDLGCVPSQINYVLSSRFTPERGFIVESRRGGGGCIRITRVSYDRDSLLTDVYSRIGERIDSDTAEGYVVNLLYHKIISEKEAALIIAATGDCTLRSLPYEYRDTVRAIIFKQMLITLIK